jgi:hypothetical protein
MLVPFTPFEQELLRYLSLTDVSRAAKPSMAAHVRAAVRAYARQHVGFDADAFARWLEAEVQSTMKTPAERQAILAELEAFESEADPQALSAPMEATFDSTRDFAMQPSRPGAQLGPAIPEMATRVDSRRDFPGSRTPKL